MYFLYSYVGYFVGHGLPTKFNVMVSAIFWFVAPIVNLFNIFINEKTRQI